jgi:tight adherence protein B
MALVAVMFALLLGFVVYYITKSRPARLVDRVEGFVSGVPFRRGDASGLRTPLVHTPAVFERMRGEAAERAWHTKLVRALDLAGLAISPYQLIAFVTLITLLVTVIAVKVAGILGILGLATPLLARTVIRVRIERTRRAFADQLPDNLDVLASSLRAGHSLVGALVVVADDASEPSKSEFRRVIADEQLGVQLEDAFHLAVMRMDNMDLEQVALVARLQREMGSNSAEVLDRVVETVRARRDLRRLIGSLTAQGRLSRWVLTALPVALVLVLSLVQGSYMHPLFHRTAGQLLLVLCGVMITLGSWAIGKIVDIKVL